MAELAISRDFLVVYGKLPRPVQRSVDAAIGRFSSSEGVVHLEKIPSPVDSRVRTFRVNEQFRGVVLTAGKGLYVLLTVKPHDEAITYAKNRLFTINQVLGVLEARDQEGIAKLEDAALPTSNGLFDNFSDSDLQCLGIEAKLIRAVRAISTDEQLGALADVLPDMQFSVLTGLASGMSFEEVFAELTDRFLTKIDLGDLSSVVRRSRMKLVDDPDHAPSIMEMVFALPQDTKSRKVASTSLSGELPSTVDGRHIDSVTAYFDKVLNSLGPPPEPAAEEQSTPLTTPLSPVGAL